MKQKIDFVKQITDEYTEISFEQAKPYYLEMLDFLHNYCEQNNIKYMMYFGTLLGAVRHKGFIPWDDDMDICMLREDFNKFVENFNSASDRYKVITWRTNGCYVPLAKIVDLQLPLRDKKNYPYIAAYIDIFPIDNEGKTLAEAKRFMHFVSFFLRVLTMIALAPMTEPFTTKFRIYFWKITKPFFMAAYYLTPSKNLLFKFIDKISMFKKKQKDTVYAGCVNASEYNERQILKKEWFNEQVLLDFEDRKYYAPKNWDQVLTTIYHEYMQLPPEEHRHHHSTTKIWIKRENTK